jgi:hypothetical protein
MGGKHETLHRRRSIVHHVRYVRKFAGKGPSKTGKLLEGNGDYAILDSDGAIIAETYRWVGMLPCGKPDLRPAETTARLFAGSPALLEACEEMLEFMRHAPFDFSNGVEYMGIDEGEVIGWRVHKELTAKLETAIVKVKGRIDE